MCGSVAVFPEAVDSTEAWLYAQDRGWYGFRRDDMTVFVCPSCHEEFLALFSRLLAPRDGYAD